MGLSPGGALVLFGLALFMYAARSALNCKLADNTLEIVCTAAAQRL